VVILGGGYGGVRILHRLLAGGLPERTQITLIDRNPYHSLKTEFYALAAGTSADKDVRVDFPKNDKLLFVFGEVEKIDTEQERIHVREYDEPVTYDYLIIGLGCEDNFHGIDGAEQYSQSVQTIKKARRAGIAVT